MEGNDKLYQLVQSARNEAPLVDLEALLETLPVEGAAGSSTSSTTFFQLKNILFMSSIITASLLSMLFLWPGTQQSTTALEKTTTQMQQTIVAPLEGQIPVYKGVNELHQPTYFLRTEPYIDPLSGIPHQPDGAVGKGTLINHFFELSSTEWKSLHATIGQKHFTYSYTSPVDSYRHQLQFNYNGSRTVTQQANSIDETFLKKMLLPLGSSGRNGAQFTNAQEDAYPRMGTLQKEWKLMAMTTPMQGGRVVWYQLSPELTDALPDRLRETLYTCLLEYNMDITPKPKGIIAGNNNDQGLRATKRAYEVTDAIHIDDVQLEKLGFKVTQGRLELKGRVKRGAIYFKCEGSEDYQSSKNYDGKLPLIPVQPLKYVPLFISKLQANSLLYSYADHDREQQKNAAELFRTRRQGLLPLIHQASFTDSPLVFWYAPSDALLNTLQVPTEKQLILIDRLHNNLKEAELKYPDLSKILELNQTVVGGSTFGGITLLEVPDETLIRLGISVENKTVVYREPGIETRFGKDELLSIMAKNAGRKVSWTTSAAINFIEDKETGKTTYSLTEDRTVYFLGKSQGTVSPKFVTDDLAQVWKAGEVTKAFRRNMEFKGHDNYVDSMVAANTKNSYLIPILVRTKDAYSKKDEQRGYQRPDCIFWYEPSDSFFALLPSDLGNALKTEIALGSNEQEVAMPFTVVPAVKDSGTNEEAQCEYFEVCKTQRFAIEDHAIYPNPTRDQLNVTLKSLEDCAGTISISSIGGKAIAQTPIVLEGGLSQQFTFSLAGIPGGIYLVNIQTDLGDQISQRIIKLE